LTEALFLSNPWYAFLAEDQPRRNAVVTSQDLESVNENVNDSRDSRLAFKIS
jgi:hypothetical protein